MEKLTGLYNNYYYAVHPGRGSCAFRMHRDPGRPFPEAIGVIRALRGEGPDERVEIVNRRGEIDSIMATDAATQEKEWSSPGFEDQGL